jgi:menaquinone-dependent protoporphyrinogen oxidase
MRDQRERPLVLVSAASRHGATLEIAQAIGEELNRCGLGAEVVPAESVDTLDRYDAVVLGSAVYFGHWLEPALELVKKHAAWLAGHPVWMFSSGPLGPPDNLLPEGDPADVAALVEQTGALAHRVFAGKLDRSQLKLREKAIVSALHAPEGDFRDWSAVTAFATEIAERQQQQRPDLDSNQGPTP